MKFYLQATAVSVFTVFVVIWFCLLQGTEVFPDPDAFYHIGMAEHLAEFSLNAQFSGLQPTTLGQHYVDQHWLFHAVLSGAAALAGTIVGTKVLTIIILLSVIALAGYVTYLLQGSAWWVTVGLLVTLNPWLFRMHLVKATPLALCWLLVAIIVLYQKRPVWLFAIGILYVWTHGGFFLLPLIVGAWCVSHKQVWPVVYSVAGIVVALLVNPMFPQNLQFYWEQLVQIGIVNYQHTIGVGGEWYPYQAGALLFGHAVVASVFLLGLVLQIAARKKFTNYQVAFLLMAIGMAVLTFKSKRYVEYFSPLAVLAAVSLLPTILSLPLKKISWWALVPLLPVVMAITPVLLSDAEGLRDDLSSGQSVNYLAGTGAYLNQLPAHQVIAPSDWDDFPALWHQAPHQQFLIGLDPTFLYLANANRYEAWKDITLGQSQDVPNDMHTVDVDYYVVAKDHQSMYRQLQSYTTAVYQDEAAWVLQVNPQ